MNHSEANAAAEGMGETIVILKRQRDELIAALHQLLDDVHDLTQFEDELPGVQQARAAIKNATGEA